MVSSVLTRCGHPITFVGANPNREARILQTYSFRKIACLQDNPFDLIEGDGI